VSHEFKIDARSCTGRPLAPLTALEEADMANDDIKTPRPGADSEEMVGSEGAGSDTEFETEEFDDEDFGDDEEPETE
jgi:hypothetical protein